MASTKLMSNSENLRCSPFDLSEEKSTLHLSQDRWKEPRKKGLEVTQTTTGSVKVQTDKPHLVSLGGGRLSTAITLLPLLEGKTLLGTADAPRKQDVVLQGTGIEHEHCIIENNDGVVMIYPIATMVAVDGYIITKPTRLSQGSMICLGRSNYFRFNHPDEAEFMKSLMPNTRISVAPINFGPDFSRDGCGTSPSSKSSSGKDSLASSSSLASSTDKRDCPIHVYRDELESGDFVDKVSKFEYLAHSQQSPVISDPHRWFVRDGIRQHATTTTTIPPVKSPPPPPPPPSAKRTASSIAASAKFAPLARIDAKISPKVFVPMIVPPVTKRVQSPPLRDAAKHSCSLEELEACQKQLEEQHQKVIKERIQEQELGEQEKQRLEEILNMCAEYERQMMKESKTPEDVPIKGCTGQQDKQQESPKPSPTHSLHINRIKTNGSLPRDRLGKPTTPESAAAFYCKAVKSTSSEDELNKIFDTESRTAARSPPSETRSGGCGGSPAYTTYPQSPRIRIKTVVNRDKSDEIYENRFAISEYRRESKNGAEDKNDVRKRSKEAARDDVFVGSPKTEAGTQDVLSLRRRRMTTVKHVAELKRRATNLETQEDEIVRELEMERALLEGEHQALLEKQRDDREKINALKAKERSLMQKAEVSREKERAQIENARLKLELEESKLLPLESALDSQPEGSPERELLVQQIAHQHELVDLERKNFEDLEFQQLENEAHREEEREQVVHEVAELEANHETRTEEIKEIDQQKEEMKKQIQKEVKNIQTERQMLMDYYQKEKDTLLTIEKKLRGLDLPISIANLDSDGSPRSSSSEGEVDLTQPMAFKKSPGDLILHVTSTSPVLPKDDPIGEKATATLRKIELNRQIMLEKEGELLIERERKRVQQLKKAAADEVRSQWEEKKQREANCNSFNSIESEASSVTSSDVLPESLSSEEYATDKTTDLDLCPSSPDDERAEELRRKVQQREAELERSGDEARPLSPTYPDDRDVKYRDQFQIKQQRPLTRYLPVRRDDFDLKQHVESAGHQIELCPHVRLTTTVCRGYLYKLGTKFRNWNKRWFVFDRARHVFAYYADKSEMRPRGAICFQYIVEVYVDHLRSVKSPNPKLTFCLKTIDRTYHLVAPSAEAMRIWIDVIFTGAEGYQEFPLDA